MDWLNRLLTINSARCFFVFVLAFFSVTAGKYKKIVTYLIKK